MARRRKDNGEELIRAIGGLIGLVVLLSFINPQVRNFLTALGIVVVGIMVLLGVVGLVYLAHKIDRRKKQRVSDGAQNIYQHFDSPHSSSSIAQPEWSHQPTPTPASLIDQLRNIDWFQFEKLVAMIYERKGYQVTRRGGANPDGGIDLTVEQGSWKAAVQCKQWKTWNVGVKPVREFLGAMTAAKIQNGIFVALKGYYGDAKQLAEENNIQMINESDLARMLEEVQIQNDPRVMEILNDTRKFCPKCERLMVERIAKKGPKPGEKFWGCSGYPKCNYILRI